MFTVCDYFYELYFSIADPSSHAVEGVGLRPLAC